MSVMQWKESLWNWNTEGRLGASNMSGRQIPEEMPPQEMEFPVPADGVIPLHVLVLNETETLTVDVRDQRSFNVSYGDAGHFYEIISNVSLFSGIV